MYSLVVVACIGTSGSCISAAPTDIFETVDECMFFYNVTLSEVEGSKDIYIMDGECVYWGKAS
jgi:hypothetical protein